jgi:hypothetical protein
MLYWEGIPGQVWGEEIYVSSRSVWTQAMITFPEKTQIQDRWVCMLVHGAHTMFYLPIHSKVCETVILLCLRTLWVRNAETTLGMACFYSSMSGKSQRLGWHVDIISHCMRNTLRCHDWDTVSLMDQSHHCCLEATWPKPRSQAGTWPPTLSSGVIFLPSEPEKVVKSHWSLPYFMKTICVQVSGGQWRGKILTPQGSFDKVPWHFSLSHEEEEVLLALRR